MAIGTAAAIGLAAAGAGAAIGGASSAKGAKKAADAQLAATRENNALAREVYASNQSALAPYQNTGMVAGNYLNAFLGLPNAPTVTPGTPGTPESGATTQAQIDYLLSVGDSKTGRAMKGYYGLMQDRLPPEELLTGLRNFADAGERQKLDAYVQANPYVAATPGAEAVTTPGVSSQDAQAAFGNFIANSDYGFQLGNGTNALNSGYAGAGTLQSGAAMKALEGFRQNLQSGYRGQYLSALGNQQGVGLSGASALAGVGQNFVNTISANNNAGASAAGNAALIKGQNNPLAGALGAIGGGLVGYG